MVHLPFLVRELSRTVAGILIDHIGRLYLREAGVAGFIQEEVDQSSLQACSFALIDREACSGYLDAEFEVDQIVFLGQNPMWELVRSKLRHCAACLHTDILLCGLACRDRLMRQIRDKQKLLAYSILQISFPLFQMVALGFHIGYFRTDGLCLVFLAGFHQSSDLLGNGVLLRQASIQTLLSFASLSVERDDFVENSSCIEVLHRQATDHFFLVFYDLLECQHSISKKTKGKSPRRLQPVEIRPLFT